MGWQQSVFQLLIVEGSGPGTGLFVYSGAPGPGNPPVLSAVSPGVTADPFGNAVVPVLELRGAAGVMTITDPAVINFLSGAITTGSIKSLTATSALNINAPNDLGITGGDVILGSNGTGRAHIYAGSDATASAPMAWIPVNPLTGFLNGWSGTFKWRFGAENEIKFQCGLTPGTVLDGTTITNLLGQSPAAAQIHAITTNGIKVNGATFEAPGLQLDTSGNVKCFGIGTAATQVSGVGFWPLDN